MATAIAAAAAVGWAPTRPASLATPATSSAAPSAVRASIAHGSAAAPTTFDSTEPMAR